MLGLGLLLESCWLIPQGHSFPHSHLQHLFWEERIFSGLEGTRLLSWHTKSRTGHYQRAHRQVFWGKVSRPAHCLCGAQPLLCLHLAISKSLCKVAGGAIQLSQHMDRNQKEHQLLCLACVITASMMSTETQLLAGSNPSAKPKVHVDHPKRTALKGELNALGLGKTNNSGRELKVYHTIRYC